MEHGESQLKKLGDADLAKIISGVHDAFKKRHPDMADIALPGQVTPIDTGTSAVNLLQRSLEEDMLTVFGCSREQIAKRASEIRPDTKAYVGPLEKGIFDRLQSVEHVYTSFPEGKIIRETVEIGGKTREQLEQELKQAGINISSYAEDMLHSRDFTTLKESQVLHTIRLRVRDLGLEGTPTINQVYARAGEFDLDPCPAEAGVYQRLKDIGQPLGEWYLMAMKQIADRDGDPSVFYLERGGDGLWLGGDWAGPDAGWDPGLEFVFSLRK